MHPNPLLDPLFGEHVVTRLCGDGGFASALAPFSTET